MNRTRLIFFAILAICVVILLASFAGQARSETLLQIYVACTVFGCGVVALDFLGLLGGHHGDATGHDFGTLVDHGAGAHDLAGGAHDGSGQDLAGGWHPPGGHNGHAASMGGEHAVPGGHETAIGHEPGTAGHEPGTAGHGHDAQGADHGVETGRPSAPVQASQAHGPNAAPVLSILAYLRLFVYFCLGFGPIGLLALWAGEGVRSLVFAVPAGIVSYILARFFFRLQRQDTGGIVPEADLLGERATVVVPLDYATMGKVRVEAGMNVSDVYALAADEGKTFERGAEVRIVRVTDDCVRVR